GLGDWFRGKRYECYDLLMPASVGATYADRFTLSVADDRALLSAFAFDCNRMALAAFESMTCILRVEALPRTTAWLLLKAYYAGFFAAHAILRILGLSCSYLEGEIPTAIGTVIDAYSMTNGLRINGGGYRCEFDAAKKRLTCTRDGAPKGG